MCDYWFYPKSRYFLDYSFKKRPIWHPKSDFFSQFVSIISSICSTLSDPHPSYWRLSLKKNENLPPQKKIFPSIRAYNMNNYRFLADNQMCIWIPPPSLPPSLIFGSFGSHFGDISWHSFPCFFQGFKIKKKMKPKFLDFRQFLTLLPSLPPSDFRLFWFLFWKYFATFFTLFSYGSRFQSNWSKNDWIFGSFWSHFGIFPDDYCVIFGFSLEYCKISDNYSKIN